MTTQLQVLLTLLFTVHERDFNNSRRHIITQLILITSLRLKVGSLPTVDRWGSAIVILRDSKKTNLSKRGAWKLVGDCIDGTTSIGLTTNSPTSLLDFIRWRVGVGKLVRRRVDRKPMRETYLIYLAWLHWSI